MIEVIRSPLFHLAWKSEPPAVLKSDPARPDRRSEECGSFILYVEGPRDRSILHAWANRLIPVLAPDVMDGTVILGGRRPARAREHFRACAAGSQALCVLDRDEETASTPDGEAGLEFFTWSRRHIESYLLVPDAIRRALALAPSDRRLEVVLDRELPEPDDASGWRALDAKRLLGDRGPLSRALGRPLPLARIARATREHELHFDVHDMFGRLRDGLARVSPPRARRHGRSAPRRHS